MPSSSWKSFGALSPARDNVIVYPTSYSAQHTDLEWLIGPDGVLDPARWFIVIPDMFGNGLSSSPSTAPDYPALVTTTDNVHAQHRLLRDPHSGSSVVALRRRLLDGRPAGLSLGGALSR